MKTQWVKENFKLFEEKDFDKVSRNCNTDGRYIVRAVSIWYEDILCGYLITCDSEGVRSFHGFKFVKGALWFQILLCRKYIEEENLRYSVYKTEETKAILKRLGFIEINKINGWTIARKT